MDCACVAADNGADVQVVYRRTRTDMPAFDKEVLRAEQAGVRFVFNALPVRIREGVVTVAQTASEGRGKLTVTDNVHDVRCDMVVSALGAYGDSSLAETARQLGLPMGGDISGGKTVAQAVHGGLQAAKNVTDAL